MKKILIFVCILSLVLGGCSASKQPVDISCMSFNVLCYAPDEDGFADATERAPAVIEFLKEQNCDIMGLQEVCDYEGYNWIPGDRIFDWHDAITSALSDEYAWRATIDEAETSFGGGYPSAGLLILYRKDRFELLESGAKDYEQSSRNSFSYYQWVKLRDKQNKKVIYVTNTHFTPSNISNANEVRLSQAGELADFWENTVKDKPLLATGDYNCLEYDEPHIQELQAAGKYFPSDVLAPVNEGTFTYDYVYVNSSVMEVNRHIKMSNEYALNGDKIKMSDHSPIVAHMTY